MPKLEILQLGEAPCWAPTGVTFKGLVVLASHCTHLSTLCVHLQAAELTERTTTTDPPSSSKCAVVIPRTDCALTDLEVGETPVPRRVALAVALTLVQIFPHIHKIYYTNNQWMHVMETVRLFKRIGGHIHHTSKTHLPHLL